jgi:hypothetical protein
VVYDGRCVQESSHLLNFLCFLVLRQPSDQYAYDGGGRYGERQDDAGSDDMDILFSPAEHTDSLKRRKDKKRREKIINGFDTNTPRVKNGKSPVESRQGTPPPALRPPKSSSSIEWHEEDDVWYAKWWMLCFPDAIKNMSPKR